MTKELRKKVLRSGQVQQGKGQNSGYQLEVSVAGIYSEEQ